MWPPGTFWERLQTGHAAAGLPLVGAQKVSTCWPGSPPDIYFGELVTLPAEFASHLALPSRAGALFALARLHGAWARGFYAIDRGEDELTEFLIEKN